MPSGPGGVHLGCGVWGNVVCFAVLRLGQQQGKKQSNAVHITVA